jgi:hypothetical protein
VIFSLAPDIVNGPGPAEISLGIWSLAMSANHAQQEAGRCIFCGKQGDMSKEHIWSDWLDEVIPRGGDHFVTVTSLLNADGNPLPDLRQKRQGAVHTKKVRRVCRTCNGGWMSNIVNTAKPHATKLIKGEQIELDADQQLAVATWLSLSAMMADLNARAHRKFPTTDLANMFSYHCPPPHWFMAVGLYDGPEPVACIQSPFARVLRDTRTGVDHLDFISHSIAMIVGRLYVIFHAITPSAHPLARLTPHMLYLPHLTQIWPRLAPIPFPPPVQLTITGSFNPDGGLA